MAGFVVFGGLDSLANSFQPRQIDSGGEMSEFVGDCPRCGIKSVTFTAQSDNPLGPIAYPREMEAFLVCRQCGGASVGLFITGGPYQNNHTNIKGALANGNNIVPPCFIFKEFVRIPLAGRVATPEHLPEAVGRCFSEGADAFCIGAHNASAAMFRLSLDLATKDLLPNTPAEEGGPNAQQRKVLFYRLAWLFQTHRIPKDLEPLADCIREDGNDGAHDGTLTKADAEDLIDFAQALLERVYTEPARLELAKARRQQRRAEAGQANGAQ